MSLRVGLLGWYGNRNLGDDALLEGLLQLFGRTAPGARVIVYATDPAALPPHPAAQVRRARVMNFAAMVKAVGDIDALVMGGGGILHDYMRFAASRYVLWALAAKLRRRPVMLAAVGVGPIRTRMGALQVRAVTALADVISVRDEKSEQWLRLIGVKKKVEVVADPALLICEPARERGACGHGQAIFALRRWPPFGGDPRSLARLLARGVDAAAQTLNTRVLLMPLHSTRDDLFCAAVRGAMEHPERARVLTRPASAAAAIELLAQARVVASMRLHALILGAMAGVPLVALACDEKLTSFMAAIGQARFCLPLESAQPDNLSAACADAISAFDASRPEVGRALEEMRSRAARMAYLVRDFLSPVARRRLRAGGLQ
jgi:polysaccharide pyruvyl transferase CsaB